MTEAHDGDIVKAKRLGWNEDVTHADITDIDILDPYEYTSDALEGPLLVVYVSNKTTGPYHLHLVGGQVADPDTITPATVVASGGKHARDTSH